MKKIMIISMVLAVSMLSSVAYAAVPHLTSADEGVAFRFYNGNTSGNVEVYIVDKGASATNRVTNGTVGTAVDGSGTDDTIAEFTALVVACTNGSNVASITIDKDCSLDADSTDGELLDGKYTAAPGEWASVLWDSSENEQLDVYVAPEDNYGFDIPMLFGNPIGTGPCTLSIYRNQVLQWQAVAELPYALNTNDAVTALSAYIELPIDVGIFMKRGEGVFLRATRTTMTGGNIGFTAD